MNRLALGIGQTPSDALDTLASTEPLQDGMLAGGEYGPQHRLSVLVLALQPLQLGPQVFLRLPFSIFVMALLPPGLAPRTRKIPVAFCSFLPTRSTGIESQGPSWHGC